MFERRTIRLDRAVHRRAKDLARRLGYASVAEFIEHLVERAEGTVQWADAQAGQPLPPGPHHGEDGVPQEPPVAERLRGLGYIE